MQNRIFRALSVMFVAGLTAGISAPSFAQAPSESTPSAANVPSVITVDAAIKAAMARNYTTRLATNTVARDAIEARAAVDNMWLPTVTGSASWNYDYSFNPLPEEIEQQGFVPIITNGDTTGYAPTPPTFTEITPHNGTQTLAYNVGASINLFNGGADIARIHETESVFNAAQNSSTWTRQQTADNVTMDYINILRNEELVYASDSTLAEAIAQLSLIKGQYEAGVVPIGQVYTQQSVVAQDSLSLIQADVNYQNSKVTLLFLLNVPPDQFANYSFTADGLDTATTPAARAAVDTTIHPDIIDRAVNQRSDILAQENEIKAAEYQVDIDRGALYPSLDASLGIGGSGSGPNLTTIHLDNGLNAGLQLTIPIFDKFQPSLTIDADKVLVENQQITLEQDVQQIRNDVAIAINNLRASEKALDASESALTAALESFRLANEQLRVGAGTEVNVVIAEAAVETARTNRVNAKYNWVLAQRQLAYDLGEWNY